MIRLFVPTSWKQPHWSPLFRTDTWRRTGFFIFWLLYTVFFFRMTRTGFRSWFSEDDLLNTYYCWWRPTSYLLRSNILLVGNYYRPAAELVYCGSHWFFGFNPVPLNIFRFVLGAVNLAVLYCFVARISRSREAGVIAVILGGYHPSTELLFVDGGMLYDGMAFFFFYVAFTIYVRCRLDARAPTVKMTAGILALNILALNSKEIAVSFPVALLLFELILTRDTQMPFWPRYRLILISSVIVLAFIIGKTTGPDSLTLQSEYRPTLSLALYLATYSRYAAEFLLGIPSEAIRPWLVSILTGCIVLAALARQRVLLWAALFNVFAILPIAFIPARGGFAFAVPLAGWLTYIAVLVSWLRSKLTLGRIHLRVPSQMAVAAIISLTVLRPYAEFTREMLRPNVHTQQDFNRGLWESLMASLPASVKHRKILLLHDPMKLGYASMFLIRLGYNERDVTVDTDRRLGERNLPVTPGAYDFVFDYVDGKFSLSRTF